jgi:hypothetical protein
MSATDLNKFTDAPTVYQFLIENCIPVDAKGVERLIASERQLNKLDSSLRDGGEARNLKVMQGYFADFLVRYRELLSLEKVENDYRAKQQALAVDLSKCLKGEISCWRYDHRLMRYPFFSSSRIKRTETIEYSIKDSKGNIRFLSVSGDPVLGLADQRDADIVRYALSKIGEVNLKTGYCLPFVTVSAFSLLKAIGKGVSKRDYHWLLKAMLRLSALRVTTNILTTELGNYDLVYNGSLFSCNSIVGSSLPKGVKRAVVEICFSPVLYYSFLSDGAIALDSAAIKQSGNLCKAIYEKVFVYMGDKWNWSVSLVKFANLCSWCNTAPLFRFKENLVRCKLPYQVTFETNKQGLEIVTFTRKKG